MMLSSIKSKYSRLAADKRFSEILTGSIFALVGRMVGVCFALSATLLVAQVYGAEMVGVLAIIQALMMLASTLAKLGMDVSILRLIPEHTARYSLTSAFRVYRKTQWAVVCLSLLVGGCLFVVSGQIANKIFSKPHLSFYISLTAVCIVFKALMDFNTQAVRGLRLIRTFAFMQGLPHAAMVLILLGMIAFSRQGDDPVFAQLAAWVLTSVVGFIILHRMFGHQASPDEIVEPIRLASLTKLSTPMFLSASMNFIVAQAGILILGMYRPENEVGYYTVAVKLASLTTFVLLAINSMAAPKFSELFHTGQVDELFYVAKKSTKLIFWVTIPILIVLIVLGHPLLSFFGEGFTEAYFPMLILVLGQFINSIAGSTGYFMNMTGNQDVLRNIMFFASALNLVFCFVLIPSFGLYGAALAGTSCLAFWNIGALLYIKHKFARTIGYFPFCNAG